MEVRILRFAIGWMTSFLLFFNIVGLLIGSLHWEYEAVILPVLCLLGAIFLFPLLGKWITKRLRKYSIASNVSRKRLKRLWSICSLPIWSARERKRYWTIWYDAAIVKVNENDALLDSWQVILQLAGGETFEEEPEVATVPEIEVIPSKILTGGLQPATYRVAEIPVETTVDIVPEPEQPLEIPIEPLPLPSLHRFDYEKWQHVVSHTRKPPTPAEETLELPFEQPTGIAEEPEQITPPEDTEFVHVLPEAITPELSDTDHHIDFLIEIPVEPPSVIETEDLTAYIADTELHHTALEAEAHTLADLDVPHAFVPEEHAVEPPTVIELPEVEIKPEVLPTQVSIPEPVIEQEIKRVAESIPIPVEEPSPIPEEVLPPKFLYIPPKLPPLPEHPAFVRKIDEVPSVKPSQLPPAPKRVMVKRPRANVAYLKRYALTALLILTIVVVGFGIYGLFRFVMNSLTSGPQVASEATMPEPLPSASLKFTIDLGECTTLKEANEELASLRDNGYAAYLYRELKRDGKIRMRVGHFARKHDAQEVGRKLIEQRYTKRFSIVSPDSLEKSK